MSFRDQRKDLKVSSFAAAAIVIPTSMLVAFSNMRRVDGEEKYEARRGGARAEA